MPSVENAHDRVVKCAKDVVLTQSHLCPVPVGAVEGRRYLGCSGFTDTIVMDLQKEFLEVFVARIA